MKFLLFSSAVLLSLIFSCDKKTKNTSAAPGLRDTITLTYGQQILLDQENLSLKFTDIQESRCPKNTNCIRAGEAIASIQLTTEAKTEEMKLQAAGMCEDINGACGESKKAMGYNFQLINIAPYPGTAVNSKGKQGFSIRLIVTKVQS